MVMKNRLYRLDSLDIGYIFIISGIKGLEFKVTSGVRGYDIACEIVTPGEVEKIVYMNRDLLVEVVEEEVKLHAEEL